MSSLVKTQVRPIEQFDRFAVPGRDMGCDGVVLARNDRGFLVWFPGHTTWSPDYKRYAPVSLFWIYENAVGQWLVSLVAREGRFDKARYDSLLPKLRKRLGESLTTDDIDVRRRSFTTVFE